MITKFKYTLPVLGLIASAGISQAALVATGSSSTDPSDATILGAVDGSDLGAAGTASGANGYFGVAGDLNDGVITPGLSGTGNSALYLPNSFGAAALLPETYTIALDVATNPLGYDVSSVETFAGWTENGPQLGNQRYTLSVSLVATPVTFDSVGTFEYVPFADNTSSGGSVTHMTVADDGAGLIGTGVHSVRFEFLDHGFSGPNTDVDGTVYYETDINGTATAAVPEPSSAALLGLAGVAMLLRRKK